MAAGKGTRMKSALPKVLHPILDRPMLGCLLQSVLSLEGAEVAVLVGSGGEEVCAYLECFPTVHPIWQREQLGTAHAVKSAQSWWEEFENLLVLNGDLPLLQASTLTHFLNEHLKSNSVCSLLSFQTETPGSYGRVVRRQESVSIVEYKDATEEERRIKEVNAGCYAFSVSSLTRVIDKVRNDNAQGEYYLPDVVALLGGSGGCIQATLAPECEMLGINTQAELAEAAARLRERIVLGWMERGVRMMDPASVWIGLDVSLEQDVTLMPDVQLWGRTEVGVGSSIGSGCILRNAVLGKNVRLSAYVVVEDSVLDDEAKAGPFAYIREHSHLEREALAGKFVELKKTHVGRSSKVPHLTYMGDATLGEDVNIGAGSVTCNFDGREKHATKIGDRCFVGSDTMMVAPVVLGDDSVTAAGSVITQDVPPGALGVGRARQRNIEGWSLRKNRKEQGG
ncbi:MAG: bifunctional UDP-N-acetylglucosamine diphosphorylase/glucosamine-1-phosphate N-acetyltransferase GlmU [Fretibacterium sp.]|nr:bifunctional UDP-N-acetylglucosamine diphosphorylase/glucosamine-1-phosphate N-acetyltransferase GlmU [Fretibacterium sp.]